MTKSFEDLLVNSTKAIYPQESPWRSLICNKTDCDFMRYN